MDIADSKVTNSFSQSSEYYIRILFYYNGFNSAWQIRNRKKWFSKNFVAKNLDLLLLFWGIVIKKIWNLPKMRGCKIVGKNFSSGKIFVTYRKFRHFSPTKFCPIMYSSVTNTGMTMSVARHSQNTIKYADISKNT